MRNAKFEVTDKAIGVCVVCFGHIHKQKCLACGPDLFCEGCLQEMVEIATEVGLVSLSDDNVDHACSVCGKVFPSKMGLLAHMRVHKREAEAE